MSSLVLVLARLVVGASLLLAPQTGQPKVPDTLYAAHYRPGLMEKVARHRNMALVDCMISSPWHMLNVWMRVESQHNGEIAICRTTDVSSPRDIATHRRHQLIELDWKTATRLCAISRVAERPPRACPVKIEVISEEAALVALAPPAPEQAAPPVTDPHPLAPPVELIPPQPVPEATAPTTNTATLTDTAALTNTAVLTP